MARRIENKFECTCGVLYDTDQEAMVCFRTGHPWLPNLSEVRAEKYSNPDEGGNREGGAAIEDKV